MLKSRFSLRNRNHDLNIERFRTRLTAKCCVVFVAVTQIIIRLIYAFSSTTFHIHKQLFTFISLPFFAVIALVICFEYFLFNPFTAARLIYGTQEIVKKIGPKVMDYSQLIDIILLVLFTAEWIISTSTIFSKIDDPENACLPVSEVFVFTGFQWRILFLIFLVQSWKLLIIPPTIALGIAIAFVASYSPVAIILTLMRGISHVVYIILLLYFLDKIKWKEILIHAQQERWIRINDFVLNNIPENIVILELGGMVTFVSDYCKAFMQKANISQNPRELFANIKDLNLQPETDLSPVKQIERLTLQVRVKKPFFVVIVYHLFGLTTAHALMDTENPHVFLQKVDSLEALIEVFQNIIKEVHLQERQFLIYNGKLQVKDHQTKSIEVKISYIQQQKKDYIILNIRDTTQRDLMVTLEDNNKYKDQLLASVSHELRAPLNGNINLVESAVQNKNVPDEIKERLLTPALRSSQYLLHLINDILDMSQIKAQKLRLIFKPRNLRETLHDTLQLVELQAKMKGVDLCLNLDSNTPHTICTDHVRLSQIVLNLLNNAIKFTQKGSVILSALPAENSNLIKISVQDSGIGMTQEDISQLFSDYTHIEFKERAKMNPTGVGLGLSIAYNLAKLLGHQGITVGSVPGQGSTFSFIVENKEDQLEPKDLLILNKNEERVPDEFQETDPKISTRISKFSSTKSTGRLFRMDSEKSECSCAKILVVDDNAFNIMAFETVLGSLNLKCDSVYDGKTALDKILERLKNNCCGQSYSVVFMDQEMPGMTGSETVIELRRLQSQNLVRQMKIIGCTAHGSPKEVNKFMESGIDLCIQKPITASGLQKIFKDCRDFI